MDRVVNMTGGWYINSVPALTALSFPSLLYTVNEVAYGCVVLRANALVTISAPRMITAFDLDFEVI
jgi:hypothetical protein